MYNKEKVKLIGLLNQEVAMGMGENGSGLPEDNGLEITSGTPIEFDGFCIESPEMPDNDDDFVMLVDEETSAVNISNLKRSQLTEIFQSIDPLVKQAFATKSNQTLSFRGSDRKINFTISCFSEDNEDIIAVSGRDIEEEGDSGVFCHDFEIEGIKSNDWDKLKALFE